MENIIQTQAPGKRLSLGALGASVSSPASFPGAQRSARFKFKLADPLPNSVRSSTKPFQMTT